eukprot:3513343-Pleurochrysis_carterae.AAC.1
MHAEYGQKASYASMEQAIANGHTYSSWRIRVPGYADTTRIDIPHAWRERDSCFSRTSGAAPSGRADYTTATASEPEEAI